MSDDWNEDDFVFFALMLTMFALAMYGALWT